MKTPQKARTEKDSKRLDWLIYHGGYIAFDRDQEICSVWMMYCGDEECSERPPLPGCFDDPRDAIDAAMKSTTPSGGRK